MFKRSEKSTNMSHLQTKVGPFTANQIIGAIGKDHRGESDKVTMEWLFEDENGDVVTLYDYKANACQYPTAQILWIPNCSNLVERRRFSQRRRPRVLEVATRKGKEFNNLQPFRSSMGKNP